MIKVIFRREHSSILYDKNSIVVVNNEDKKELGHLEKSVAAGLEPLLDMHLPGFRLLG